MAESLNCKMPIPWCLTIIIQNLLIPTALGKFDSHSSGKSEIHKFSVMAMQNFLAVMRRQTAPIDQQLNRLMQAQMVKNREKMKSIPLASSGIRPSISSLMEKLILVETRHKNCWIHPWSLCILDLLSYSFEGWHRQNETTHKLLQNK